MTNTKHTSCPNQPRPEALGLLRRHAVWPVPVLACAGVSMNPANRVALVAYAAAVLLVTFGAPLHLGRRSHGRTKELISLVFPSFVAVPVKVILLSLALLRWDKVWQVTAKFDFQQLLTQEALDGGLGNSAFVRAAFQVSNSAAGLAAVYLVVAILGIVSPALNGVEMERPIGKTSRPRQFKAKFLDQGKACWRASKFGQWTAAGWNWDEESTPLGQPARTIWILRESFFCGIIRFVTPIALGVFTVIVVAAMQTYLNQVGPPPWIAFLVSYSSLLLSIPIWRYSANPNSSATCQTPGELPQPAAPPGR